MNTQTKNRLKPTLIKSRIKTLFLASMSVLLMLACNQSNQPEWRKKGFDTEVSYLYFLQEKKDNYFDSLEKVLPSVFASSGIIGKYLGHYKNLIINQKGIMRIEYPVTNRTPTYVPINLNKPRLWESLYGHGLEIMTNYKYDEENDRYKFEYHENDISSAYPIIGYEYYSDGSFTSPEHAEGYITEKGGADLLSFFSNKGFKTLKLSDILNSDTNTWAKYWESSPKIQY
jgi:hypothetical protein